MKNKMKILVNGIFKENPVLVLVLGCCSVLAISVTVKGSLGMGAALTFVLVGSNVVISALRKIIPDKIRIPCYIVVVATFVTLVEMVVHAYLVDLYNALGIFLPLIVVNCIVLGRAEMFANKNTVLDSLFDGLGMGIGYTMVGGTRFYDRAEIRDMLAYLKVINNFKDNISLARIINTPKRGIGGTTVEKLLDYANAGGMSMFEGIMGIEGSGLSSATQRKLTNFSAMIFDFLNASTEMNVFELIQKPPPRPPR